MKQTERSEKLNYLICRCADIAFYCNPAVFRSEIKSKYDIKDYNNLEDFQVEYLHQMDISILQIRKFLEKEYDREVSE